MFTHRAKQKLSKVFTGMIFLVLFFASFAPVPAHASILDDTFTGIDLHTYNSAYKYRSDGTTSNDSILTLGGITSGSNVFSEDYYAHSAISDMSSTLYINNTTRLTNVYARMNLSTSGSTWAYSEKQDYGCQVDSSGNVTLFIDN